MSFPIPRRTWIVGPMVCVTIATAQAVAQDPPEMAAPSTTPSAFSPVATVPNAGAALRHPPVLKYDPATDRFTHHESILSPVSKVPPGGQTPYHGNRLHQFRYFGPVGTGGIYEAITEYQEKLKLDPRNYRYRFH